MKKIYVFVLLLLLSNYAFSQTGTSNQLPSEKPAAIAVNEPVEKEPVLSKIPLPSDQKVSQEVFYIVNDKPVDRLKYQQHLQQTAGKK